MEHKSRAIPEHAVPLPLSVVAGSRTSQIEYGKVKVDRVQVMGCVKSIEMNECDMEFIIVDMDYDNDVMCQKVLSSSFPRELAEQLQPGHLIEIYGKVRVSDGQTFLNALAIHIVTQEQYDAFQTLCRIANMYYEDNLPTLPNGTSTKTPTSLGLKAKLGSLDRFPVNFLEDSPSNVNNMGEWPKEIDYLAEGRDLNEIQKDSEDVDVFADVKKEEEDVEEEDSFDAGPMILKKPKIEDVEAEDVKNSEEIPDSFEAGPPKGPALEEQEEEAMEYDSFENI